MGGGGRGVCERHIPTRRRSWLPGEKNKWQVGKKHTHTHTTQQSVTPRTLRAHAMPVLCAMRDFLIFALSASSLHTALYATAAREMDAHLLPAASSVGCPYFDAWSVVFLAGVTAGSGASLVAFTRGWESSGRWTWAVDLLGMVPGMLWMVSTRAAAYGMGGLTTAWDHCSEEHVPAALVLSMLGGWLTYGTILRLCTMDIGFGTRPLPTCAVALGSVALTALQYVIAWLFRERLAD